jgi:alanyl-tRNA synthetase
MGIPTLSFHLGQESSTIDVGVAALDAGQVAQIERRANAVVFENRPVTISFVEAGPAADLRKPSEREGTLRVVSIADLDRSACGGTHVRATGEIGPVLIRKLDKIRGSVRIEFLCGRRAVERARADYDALARISRSFSAPPDETPALVEAQIEKLRESEKARRKLAVELAQSRGRELHEATAAGAGGLRRAVRTLASGALDDALRAEAQAFAARGGAVFVVAIESPPALLLACSADSGMAAGATLQPLVAALGGRGGGNAAMAQGSLPSVEAVREAVRKLSG